MRAAIEKIGGKMPEAKSGSHELLCGQRLRRLVARCPQTKNFQARPPRPKVETGGGQPQRAQYPLIKEYILNDNVKPSII